MSEGTIKRKLRVISTELSTLRSELAVLEEQLVYVEDVADDSRLRSLVSETPLAAQEHKESIKSVKAIRRDYEAKQKKLLKLEQKQDKLLDKLSSSL